MRDELGFFEIWVGFSVVFGVCFIIAQLITIQKFMRQIIELLQRRGQ